MITFYFKEDTFLIPNPIESVIRSNDYLDQSGASRFLAGKGLDNFPQRKIATYIQRGTFPKEDLVIAGKKFWKIKTIKEYAAEQMEKKSSIVQSSVFYIPNLNGIFSGGVYLCCWLEKRPKRM